MAGRTKLRIAVIAPSGPFDHAAFEVGLSRLRERYDVHHEPSITERHGFLAGTDERRLGEFRRALSDPSVDVICCARGGYGSTRLLPNITVREVQEAQKLLVGFSDITALHCLWARAKVPSVHGRMVAALGRASAEHVAHWHDAVRGETAIEIRDLETIRQGRAEGLLVGGNLSVLAALVGTPYAPPLGGAILLLEDVGERPYRLDRMLTTLEQCGWLAQVRGVILGAFNDCTPADDGVTAANVLRERLGRLKVPVLAGAPIGHIEESLDVPLGVPAVMDASAGTLHVAPRLNAGA